MMRVGFLQRCLSAFLEDVHFFVRILCNAKLFAGAGPSTVPFYLRRQRQLALAYAAITACLSLVCAVVVAEAKVAAFLLGLMVPAAGFLHWMAGDQVWLAGALFVLGFCVFVASLVLWFATGNLVAPLLTWAGMAVASGWPQLFGLSDAFVAPGWPFAMAPMLAVAAGVSVARRPRQSSLVPGVLDRPVTVDAPVKVELSAENSQRLRVLLDRALQPVDRFDGFEWRDQFQTAAVRYQVNFLSYALAMAKANHTGVAHDVFDNAQRRLQVKIGDHRLWRYWSLENAWGNLRLGADPVPDQNIMYTGFTLLQMAIGEAGGNLVLRRRGQVFRSYTIADLAGVLATQFDRSPYGLIPCEPNWIYPLCNLFTMAGLRATDARHGTTHWSSLSRHFLRSLDQEATRPDGRFIAFRSALTGIAPPAPGGIVMQSFPCLFLNALSPELAHAHWQRVRRQLDSEDWKKLFWPIDVGNYGFSRAAGYAATAAAAVELGDREVADECFRRLEVECPSQCDAGAIHRAKASLWAHALEVFARCNRPNGFHDLVVRPLEPVRPDLAADGMHGENVR